MSVKKFYKIALLFVPALIALRCVSRTVPSTRWRESGALMFTSPAVTLPDPDHYSFAVVGDLHIQRADTARFRRILQAAKDEGDAFGVFLGDLVDSGERTDALAFRQALADFSWSGKAFPVIGNHDIFNDGWSSYKELNGPSHYVFQVGNAKFIVLDTADGSLGDTQAKWLEAELALPRPTHLFLASHYLPTVPGIRTYLKLANETEAMHLMSVAAKNNVTGWLGAHYHSFVSEKIEGVEYLVAGGGGGKRMDPVPDYFFVQVKVDGPGVSYLMRTVE